MATLETVIHHASDHIDWIEATGIDDAAINQPVNETMDVALSAPPRDLQPVNRPGRMLLWRSRPETLHQTIADRASAAQMARPSETPYQLSGALHDPAERYNPRLFTITAGNASGPQVPLYRSPFGTAIGAGGSLIGSLRYENGDVASWAVLELTVTLHIAGVLRFRAQADRNGEFILPLNRLPVLNRNAPRPDYVARLQVLGDPGVSDMPISDPDSFNPCLIASADSAGSFTSEFDCLAQPRLVTRITSHSSDHIILRHDP